MYPASERFLASIRRGGKRKTVVDLYFNNTLVLSDVGVKGDTGSITCDRTNAVRRSGTVTLTDPRAIELLQDDDQFYGLEIVPRSGIVYNRMSEELIPMGVFTVDQFQIQRQYGDISADVTFFDRAKVVDRAGFVKAEDYSGRLVTDAITELVSGAHSSITGVAFSSELTVESTLLGLPGGTIIGGDSGSGGRMQTVQDLCARLGGELYFDWNGQPVVVPTPSVNLGTKEADALWRIDAGGDGVMIDATPQHTRDGMANVVSVFGTSPGNDEPAPWAMAIDLDPRSPTRANGPAGYCTYRVDSHPGTSTGECQAVAATELLNRSGLARSIALESTVNPCLWSGDLVYVIMPDSKAELHILDQVTTPLGSGSQTATTRSVQYAG